MSELWTRYPAWLALISLVVLIAERLWPRRREQRALRPGLLTDVVHLIVNGHFLGVALYAAYDRWIHAPLVRALEGYGLADVMMAGVASSWPIALQIIVALLAIDFVQWCVHNLLHRVGPLWAIHKIHHSVVDGQMDWIVSFRFHWLEVVVYRSLLYLPLAFFGFGPAAIMVHAVFGTLIGHLNHANLDLGHGRWRYLLNSPRMHLWHHDFDAEGRSTKNFGIIFSAWDWLFGTAYMPETVPRALGFAGVEEVPRSFGGHALWPLSGLLGTGRAARAVVGVVGAVVMVALYAVVTAASASTATVHADLPPGPRAGPQPDQASSQPARITAAMAVHPADAARAALVRMGSEARQQGWAHPEAAISADELAAVLGAPELVLLDVRARARFEQGHIPTAQVFERDDYSVSAPVPGLSRTAAELVERLRARGVSDDSVVVLYGDGGAEPYRLWWTLAGVLGRTTRVLDGGIQAWKRAGLPTTHEVHARAPGQLGAVPERRPRAERWDEVVAMAAASGGVQLVDTRTADEFRGRTQDPRAARAGHIPGAIHLSWVDMLVSLEDPRLKPLPELRAVLARAGIDVERPIVGYCQSATRSAVTYYALHQLGVPDERLANYGGSWAEYSRLDAAIAH